jgi:hypothetical protein
VRSYTDKKVDRETVQKLLEAAVQAPSVENSQPWAFVVIQDSALLRSYSARGKAHELRVGKNEEHIRELLRTPEFDLFYRASTLVLICARRGRAEAVEDCAFAAQNLMLAACALDLGTCPIGLARSFLNLPRFAASSGSRTTSRPCSPSSSARPRSTRRRCRATRRGSSAGRTDGGRARAAAPMGSATRPHAADSADKRAPIVEPAESA